VAEGARGLDLRPDHGDGGDLRRHRAIREIDLRLERPDLRSRLGEGQDEALLLDGEEHIALSHHRVVLDVQRLDPADDFRHDLDRVRGDDRVGRTRSNVEPMQDQDPERDGQQGGEADDEAADGPAPGGGVLLGRGHP